MSSVPFNFQGSMAPVRTVIVVSPDAAVRSRLRLLLAGMRWSVAEAAGGAEAMGHLDERPHEALLVDTWLPDLEVSEFSKWVGVHFPSMDLIHIDGAPSSTTPRSPRRNELLHVLRQMEESSVGDGAVWRSAPLVVPRLVPSILPPAPRIVVSELRELNRVEPISKTPIMHLPGIVGSSVAMRELASMVSMVAPRSATVLIEGETGTGKELVALAVHRLSDRSSKPLVVLNCAAIPESLLEAELFGHTRGAFTGAVQSRVGRIEAANGGTLFLDEIGEMPLALQAKMLRFLECGELQRIGDNEISRVDVRVVAATHQPLEQHAAEGKFRLDLYHRLAVFPVEVPPLRERMEDLPMLVEHILSQLGLRSQAKRMGEGTLEILCAHTWPGNVRELGHVLERASILSGQSAVIQPPDIRIRSRSRAS
ncbi:sigma-54 interaction domain-containing protein [Terriglobus saanensis]|uniref:Putative two component, sigma54 specific, transcriptional regulator, Fis family n=1 Tax=Terriglobus saanensis (strain ATCC BAA-1853 / DSM 23119 / SP1PR4) TaxID=401053 RepID=E8V4Y6_TERSS|nr:sigma-54 dependent transcriptional regulator [Terriglobus saanensis]ADV82614.1 putative two component, sigma54 specific, transcriptional regulator, Fis family [Terriglobus saanensis SP1PR4]